jgi:hypothetical protein
MHICWFSLILRLLCKLVRTGDAGQDVRSDDENSEDDTGDAGQDVRAMTE